MTFLPQITDYDLHEWLGLAVGATLIVHLIQHWQWMVSISKNLYKSQAHLLICYFLHGLLASGKSGIILTGLVISSILSLSLVNYEAWYVVHFSISYISLVLLLLKIALHWKQINNVIACLFKHERCEPEMTCSYPGKCCEYVDRNSNGYCDRGECIWSRLDIGVKRIAVPWLANQVKPNLL